LFWWSIYALSFPACNSIALRAVGAISPMFITFLLFKVSGIPLLENSADLKYKDNAAYTEYKRKTPILVPFL
jgi:steroid 5-alpha reductase family enzyme